MPPGRHDHDEKWVKLTEEMELKRLCKPHYVPSLPDPDRDPWMQALRKEVQAMEGWALPHDHEQAKHLDHAEIYF